MNKSLFSLSLRKPDSSLYSVLFLPNSEFARNSTGNEISAETVTRYTDLTDGYKI